jgi:hypothetical protein
MSNVNIAQAKAKAVVIDQLAHCYLKKNNNGMYSLDSITTTKQTIEGVLTKIFNIDEYRKGMSGLLAATPNIINTVETSKPVSMAAMLQQSRDKATAATLAARVINPTALTIAP